MSNIVDLMMADKNLATMLKGIKAAGLDNELSQPGPYTLFAPMELAFGKLVAGELNELMKPENKPKLTALLNNHVVEGKFNFKDFFDGQVLKTISGKELNVKATNSNITINGSAIMGRDTDAANGVVHSLNILIKAN